MRVAIMGGKLQGVEAAYLAKKAGWEVVLFDRRKDAQASILADTFHCLDILHSSERIIGLLKGIDLMIPVIEDVEVIKVLEDISHSTKIPFAFDSQAYTITASKNLSNELFKDLKIPSPNPWPFCQFPIILKPTCSSGSDGVRLITTKKELDRTLQEFSEEEFIIEEYLEGPSYSIEVIGFGGEYRVFEITELFMDSQYDCKRVIAPVALDPQLRMQFEEVAIKIAKKLFLNGIMDVETILHQGTLKVLEIDARLPSQTPTAVYHATGVNMLEHLGYSFLNGCLYNPPSNNTKCNIKNEQHEHVIYEHFSMNPQEIEASGEHILSRANPLQLHRDFFGADEALIDYTLGKKEGVFTLITKGTDEGGMWNKRNCVLQELQKAFDIPFVLDPSPQTPEPLTSIKELNRYDSIKGKRYRNNRRKIKRIRRRIGENDGSYAFGYCCLCGWHACYRFL